MTQVEQLIHRLTEAGITNFDSFPGTLPDVTKEQLAEEINKSLDQLKAGNFEEIK